MTFDEVAEMEYIAGDPSYNSFLESGGLDALLPSPRLSTDVTSNEKTLSDLGFQVPNERSEQEVLASDLTR